MPLPTALNTMKPWLIRGAKLAVLLLVFWFIRRTLHDAWDQLTRQDSGLSPWNVQPLWLIASGAIYLLGFFFAGLFWRQLLRGLGQEAGLGETLRAYYIGHLGKYVPGKAMVVVLRAGLIRSHRVSTAVAAVSVFLETFTWLAVGGFLAATVLAVQQRGNPAALWGAVLMMVVMGVPTLPPVFRAIVRTSRTGRRYPETVAHLEKLNARTVLTGWLLNLLVWALLGVSYWAVLRGMGIAGVSLWHLPRYVGSVALATLAGFIILILPGGIGVREAALIEQMVPYLEPLTDNAAAIALLSAVWLRVVWLLAEVAISGILYVAGPRPTAAAGPQED